MANFNYVPGPGDSEEVRRETEGDTRNVALSQRHASTSAQPDHDRPESGVVTYVRFRKLVSPRRRAALRKQMKGILSG